MRRSLPALLALVLICLPRMGWAAAAVFGSFINSGNAERLCVDLAQRAGLETRMVAVATADGERFRVISLPMDEAGTRAAIARAQSVGVNAWYWAGAPADAPGEAPTEAIAEAESAPPEPRAEVVAPETTAEEAAEVADTEVAATPSAELRLETAGEAVVVPRFDAVSIDIDGRLDEAVWAEVPGYDEMVVVEPDTLGPTRHRTVVRYLYTDQGLYIGTWNEQPPETLIARLSGRDDYINRDAVGITLDTSGKGLYGYWFNIALGGSVMDGKIAPERNFSREWDGPWSSATAELDDGWSAEVFLPWSMMTMPQDDGDRVMGFFANRKVAYIDERWGWPPLPRTAGRFMSVLAPMSLPGVAPAQQLEAFPYISSSMDGRDGSEGFSAGLDVFWRPSSNFQITAAALPDFGAVESDDVVINLTARETFYPEKRLFFLEGSEIFATSGRSATLRPGRSGTTGMTTDNSGSRQTMVTFRRTPSSVLNTRRIGGAPIIEYADDLDVEDHRLSQPTELLGAAKVTGQSGAVRYGVLTAFEDDPVLRGSLTERDGSERDINIRGTGRNFGVARVLYENVGDSGRQAVGYIGTLMDHALKGATVHGLDAQVLSADGKWRAELQALSSDIDCTAAKPFMTRRAACPDEGGSKSGQGGWMDIYYTQRQGLQHSVRLDYFDENLDIRDLGFLERGDQYGGLYAMTLIRPGTFGLRRFTTNFSAAHWLNFEGQNTRTGVFFLNTFTFNNLNELRTSLRYFPRRWEDLESRGNGVYRIQDRGNVEVAFGSDTSRPVSWSAQLGALGEDLGGMGYTAALGVTYKPIDRFSVDFDFTYRRRDGWLRYVFNDADFATFDAHDLQPRLATDYFISAHQQIRLTMQWAGIRAREQEALQIVDGVDELQPRYRAAGEPNDDFTISQLTMQLRYRWQIAPLSDLFVVYTRGSNLANAYDQFDPASGVRDGFGHLYWDAFTEPLVDVLVVKLRYRLGS